MADPLLFELGLKVSEGFSKLLSVRGAAESLNVPHLTSEAERFQLWAHSLGLHQEGHASLDYRVRDAVILKERLAELLQQLINHSENIFSIVIGERKPVEIIEGLNQDDSSSSSSSCDSGRHTELSSNESSFHEVEFRIQSLEERLNALYSLATRIRNPRNRPSRTIDDLYKRIPVGIRAAHIHECEQRETNIASYILQQHILQNMDRKEIEALTESASEDILSRYTSYTSWLVRRTGIANARRKQQLLYWKEHSMRLGRHSHNHIKTAQTTPVKQDISRTGESVLPTTMTKRGPTAPSFATSATPLPNLKPEDLKSVISTQSRTSFITGMQNEALNWPPPPKGIGPGEYFECPYCRVLCPARYLKNVKDSRVDWHRVCI
ncbi:hypothetical protein GGS24DRAFT_511493 [Hypoxylon argillaceum]|nr:hypothetical protein GGS24DRAFT_511493 [Hypoxylon argillaceum]